MSRSPWWLTALLLLACGPSREPPSAANNTQPPTTLAPAATPNAAESVPAPATSVAKTPKKLEFLHDDVQGALQRAKKQRKALFVDAWAPWCHTCLSMKHYVFVDPSLAPLSERMLFVAIDTDRPENAAFVEKYAIDVWPTFFVLNPESGEVIGFWPGAASVSEIRELAEDALDVFDAEKTAGKAADELLVGLVRARAAHAERRYDQAAGAYAAVIRKADKSWPRRSEALYGWLGSLSKARRAKECVEVGMQHLAEVSGAAIPGDFARTLFDCSNGIKDATKRRAARQAAVDRMRQIVASPSPEASVDDRADALDILAGSLDTLGDSAGSRKAHEDRLALLEQAAKLAPSPQAASTYDYQRATAYLELGRGEQAVKMLEERERQLPDSYEPSARLASVLAEMGRHADALRAIDRALVNAYGPRRLRYLALKARVQQALGDRAGQIATLEQELSAWKELGKRASPDRLKDAERRLQAARRTAPR